MNHISVIQFDKSRISWIIVKHYMNKLIEGNTDIEYIKWVQYYYTRLNKFDIHWTLDTFRSSAGRMFWPSPSTAPAQNKGSWPSPSTDRVCTEQILWGDTKVKKGTAHRKEVQSGIETSLKTLKHSLLRQNVPRVGVVRNGIELAQIATKEFLLTRLVPVAGRNFQQSLEWWYLPPADHCFQTEPLS